MLCVTWMVQILAFLSRWNCALVEKHTPISSLSYLSCAIRSNSVTSILAKKPHILWELVQPLPCHFSLMIYYRVQLVTGNWNSADLLLNCGRDSFLLKTEADYLDEKAADLEMYSMQYVITTQSAQTAAICHKLWLLLATLHSNMWPNLDEQPLSKYRVEWCHF